MALIDLKDAQIQIMDGGANYVTVSVGEGNLEYAEKRNVEAVKRRGELDTVREGDEEAMDVSFQFVWESLEAGGGDPPTVEDALKRRGPAASWQSVSSDPDAPFCVNIAVVYTPPCGEPGYTLWLQEFHYTELAHSLRDSTVDCKGMCNRTRASQVSG